MYMHTCTHTHLHTHHTHVHTEMSAHTQHAHTDSCTQTHTCMPTHKETLLLTQWGFLGRFPSSVNRACGDKVGVGRSHGSLGARGGAESSVIWEGTGNPLQYSCLENPMDGETWWATVHGVAKSRTRLSNFTFFHFFFSVAKGGGGLEYQVAWRGEESEREETWSHQQSNV